MRRAERAYQLNLLSVEIWERLGFVCFLRGNSLASEFNSDARGITQKKAYNIQYAAKV